MEKMHNLLRRQLKKSFGEDFAAPAEWSSFLEAVNSAYREFDTDRAMLEHTMDLSSRELMQLNADLRKSERRYHMLFERAPLGLIHFDQQGVVIDCNDHILQIIGSTREKLIGLDMPRQLTNRGVLQALESCFAEGKGTYEGDYRPEANHHTAPVQPADLGRWSGHRWYWHRRGHRRAPAQRTAAPPLRAEIPGPLRVEP
ncbi:MAG: PAS domain S-box protein [bacterium]